jgi:hypothetical protein
MNVASNQLGTVEQNADFPAINYADSLNLSTFTTNKYFTLLFTRTIHYPLSYAIKLQFQYPSPLVT